jgi:hypothetical protein
MKKGEYKDEQQAADFIAHHYQSLMTEPEWLAVRALIVEAQAQVATEGMARLLRERYQPTDIPLVRDALQQGWDLFVPRVAARILREASDAVDLNRCPDCGRIPRTPRARQCPWCFHSWHHVPR